MELSLQKVQLPDSIKERIEKYRSKLDSLFLKLQEKLRKLQQKLFALIDKSTNISFDDFYITKELLIEEYLQKKDEFKEIKYKAEDSLNGYVYMHEEQCYSFNYFANIFLKQKEGESKLLIIENHVNANKTRIMFAYHLKNNEHVYDQYVLELNSKFYQKDLSKMDFLMQYYLKTLDNIYIMSDKPYFKLAEINAFVAINQVPQEEILSSFEKIKILDSTTNKLKLWGIMIVFAFIFPISTFFIFNQLLDKLNQDYINKQKSLKIKITASDNQINRLKQDIITMNEKIKLSKKEIYEPKK